MEEERRRCTKEVSCQPLMMIVGETWVKKYSEKFLMSRPRLKRVEAKEADRTRDADPMEKLKNDLLDLHFLVEEIAGKEEERP